MGKTVRKFSKKGKKTQYRRKTKGRKPIRRKSARRGKKMGGDAGVKLNEKVEAIKTYIKDEGSGTTGSIDEGSLKQMFEPILAAKGKFGKESCTSWGTSDWTCERRKFDAYVKAKHLAETYLPTRTDLIEKLDEKIKTRKSHAAEIESYSKGKDHQGKGKIDLLKEEALKGLENIKSDAEKQKAAYEHTREQIAKRDEEEALAAAATQYTSKRSPTPKHVVRQSTPTKVERMQIFEKTLNAYKREKEPKLPSLALLLNKIFQDRSFTELKHGTIVTSTAASCVNNTGSVSGLSYIAAKEGRTQYDLCDAIGGINTKGYDIGFYHIYKNDTPKKYLTNTNEFLTQKEIKTRNGVA